MKKLERITFEVSRELEFFTEKELTMQIGHERAWWPVSILRELVDNSLDACETASIAPLIEVGVDDGGFSVQDNGPGLPAETLARSLDYLKRVSDKVFYVSPTRGQMGNALKVVWAAPFVADGEHGQVEVWSQGVHHTVEVSIDRIAQRPRVDHVSEEDGLVRNGTLVRVHWLDPSSSTQQSQSWESYNVPTARELVEGYAIFNPHATFRFGEEVFEATDPQWKKWRPDDPTSPHWYRPETLRDLIAAYVVVEEQGGRRRTVREFVSEFRGLSSTAKQKQVADGFSGVYLRDLVDRGDIDLGIVGRLLAAMQEGSNAVKPAALGVIGEEHIKSWMVRYAGVAEASVRYARRLGKDSFRPHVVEVAFGVRKADDASWRRVTGLNWSPALRNPVPTLDEVIREMRVDQHDPVTIVAHLARPGFEFVDQGKTRLDL